MFNFESVYFYPFFPQNRAFCRKKWFAQFWSLWPGRFWYAFEVDLFLKNDLMKLFLHCFLDNVNNNSWPPPILPSPRNVSCWPTCSNLTVKPNQDGIKRYVMMLLTNVTSMAESYISTSINLHHKEMFTLNVQPWIRQFPLWMLFMADGLQVIIFYMFWKKEKWWWNLLKSVRYLLWVVQYIGIFQKKKKSTTHLFAFLSNFLKKEKKIEASDWLFSRVNQWDASKLKEKYIKMT